jgi:hypothetical protein
MARARMVGMAMGDERALDRPDWIDMKGASGTKESLRRHGQ